MRNLSAVQPLAILVTLFIAAAAPSAVAADKDAEVKAKLETVLLEAAFDGLALNDALSFIQDIAGVKIVTDWAALKKVGIDGDTQVSVKMKNAKLSKVLTALLDSAAKKPGKVGYSVKGGAIHIAPK